MCHCDSDEPEFYNANFVKGRTIHRCCECLRDIPSGEMQEVASGKWEGDFITFRTCMTCVDIRNELNAECWAHGYLFEEVSSGDHDHIESVRLFQARREQNFNEKYRRVLDV